MKYKINSIFYSIQGEGEYVGKPAIFIRFAGCNLQCPFCDTKHDDYKEMSTDEILEKIKSLGSDSAFSPTEESVSLAIIVLTGGEPMLQIDDELMKALKSLGLSIHLETNGTIYKEKILSQIDWVTCSPKTPLELPEEFINEMKIIVNEKTKMEDLIPLFNSDYTVWLQPESLKAENIKKCISLVKDYPNTGFNLGFQLHKIYGIE